MMNILLNPLNALGIASGTCNSLPSDNLEDGLT
jgi:hypothetical protein